MIPRARLQAVERLLQQIGELAEMPMRKQNYSVELPHADWLSLRDYLDTLLTAVPRELPASVPNEYATCRTCGEVRVVRWHDGSLTCSQCAAAIAPGVAAAARKAPDDRQTENVQEMRNDLRAGEVPVVQSPEAEVGAVRAPARPPLTRYRPAVAHSQSVPAYQVPGMIADSRGEFYRAADVDARLRELQEELWHTRIDLGMDSSVEALRGILRAAEAEIARLTRELQDSESRSPDGDGQAGSTSLQGAGSNPADSHQPNLNSAVARPGGARPPQCTNAKDE